jgi:hypothetical protein
MASLIGALAWLGLFASPVALIAGIVYLPAAYRKRPLPTTVVAVIIGSWVVGGILIVGASSTI